MDRLPEPVYIAGPMTGLPDKNRKAFADMEWTLRASGHVAVENPVVNEVPDVEMPYEFYLRAGFAQLLRCQSIVLLPGWKTSQGAVMERQIAEWLGMTVVEMHEVRDE
jgi:hypothetical protein